MVVKKLVKHETYIIIGFLMVILTLAKLLGFLEISSDWFWFIAGLALVFEGAMNLTKQKTFNKKFKVVSKQEFNELWKRLEDAEKKK